MTFAARICSLLMVVLLAVTAQSAAVARTMPGPAGQMVICTGSGPQIIYMDEDGAPTGAPHVCPDCALALFAHGVEWQAAFARVLRESALDTPLFVADAPRLRVGARGARGPPVWV